MWTISNAAAPPVRNLRMALEPRLMLDGDPAIALAEAVTPTPAAASPSSQSGESLAAALAESAPAAVDADNRHEILFVFSDVADWSQLAAAAANAAEVIVIDPAEDGLARMVAELEGRQDIDAIHVVAHGAAGEISLGSAMLDIASVTERAADLSSIGAALAADGDLLFYGCDVGAGDGGAILAQALADATGADVALSADATGAAALGGDWNLEVRAGNVEAAALSAPEWGSLLAVQTSVVSVAVNGADSSSTMAVSADGRFVAFTSSATNLVTGDTNGVSDVFLRNTVTGTTTRISVGPDGAQANGNSVVSDISDDGRYVVFSSTATNLLGAGADTNGQQDVFVRDTQTNTTTLVSRTDADAQTNGGPSSNGTISADGRYVAFLSSATNMGDPNGGTADVFLRDLTANSTVLVSVSLGINGGNGAAGAPQISSNGSVVVFTSAASNMVAGDTNNAVDVFLRNVVTNAAVVRVNTDAAGGADSPSVSADGTRVAFRSTQQLAGSDNNAYADIYVRNMPGPAYTMVTAGADAASSAPVISGNGNLIAFESAASHLAGADTNGVSDIFLWDRSTNPAGVMSRVSVASAGAVINGASNAPALGANGTHVAFRTGATNLAGPITLNAGTAGTSTNQSPPPPPPPPPDGGPVLHAARDTIQTIGGVDPSGAPPPPLQGTAPLGDASAPPSMLSPLALSPLASASNLASPPPNLTGSFGLQPPPPGTEGFDQLSLEQRRAMMHGMRPPAMRQALLAESEPAAQVAADIVTQIASGTEISLAEAKLMLEQEGASPEVTRAYLAAVQQAIKAVRTGQLAGALQELGRDATAADAFSSASNSPLKDIQITGNRVAILIGVEAYKGVLPGLATPGNDVTALSAVLAERFGYQTIVAQDATKADVVGLIRSVGERLDEGGSLMVYYAGHGYAVEATGEGYWLPSDARADNAANWVSTRDLSGYLGQVKASQIMVVSDSCYSGAMTREMRLTSDAVGLSREQMVQRRSVTALSSGGEEPVADGGPGGHSVFAANLLKTLESADAGTIGFNIFGQVRSEVAKELPQVPTYGALTSAGHAGATDYVIGGR